ncbi:hypothetical protein GTH32_07860 [Alteromonas sp. 345S023]|jgi:hypothetical protein|uniref:Uncharacterized protein n=1 Tax=Alteromonas profundi TaxID=2696062 RepID=A0A7X5RKK9_9ALTE|nr:hypothetical protein [Alteromonas profundi]NDV91098.1 hypothetical protein [Alteromonas profundi]
MTSCYVLHQFAALPVVLSAALVGFAASFWSIPRAYGNHTQAAVYAGAFAGMCSSSFISTWQAFAIVCVLGALFYTLTRSMFEGIGGRLGAIAFAAVGSVVLVRDLL